MSDFYPFTVYVTTKCETTGYQRTFHSKWMADEFKELHEEMGFNVVMVETTVHKELAIA